MEDRQEPVRSERAKEETLTALAVVDELALHGTVHSVRSIGQIANRELRPVLAVAVGQNAICRKWPIQAYHRRVRCVNGPNCLNGEGLPRRIEDLDFEIPHG